MRHNLVLEGASYRLRPITVEDAAFVIEVRLQDKERNKYINPIPPDIGLQQEWIKKYFERAGDYYFVVENRLSGTPEGLIGIYEIENGKAEWGRWVLKKDSLASIESVDLIFKAAFLKIGLKEIYCRTIAENTAVVSFHDSLPQERRGVLSASIAIGDTKYDAVEHFVTQSHYEHNLRPELERRAQMIFARNFRSILGKMEFHHIGVATKSIQDELHHYQFLGYQREGTVFEDPNQGIRGLFITADNQPRLELLENLPESTTLDRWLEQKNKMYHFAYKVVDIERAIEVFNRNRIRTVSPLKTSTYFGKRICFLALPNLYLIELIES